MTLARAGDGRGRRAVAHFVLVGVLGVLGTASAQTTTTTTGTSTSSITCVPACDDGNVCNGVELCQGGVCVPGTPLNCADVSPCTVDSCNPVLGICEHAALPDGTTCNDGTVCNGLEVCTAGICFPGTPLDCDDGVPCSVDVCDPGAGCLNIMQPDGAACDDGVFCNGPDTCSGGSCVVHIGDPCTGGPQCANTCNEAADNCFAPDGAPCANDGDACTADVCEDGICASTPSFDLCLDEFLCYKARNSAGEPKFVPIEGLSLADELESGAFDVKKPGHVCTPADMDGGGTIDAATHLEAYRLRLPPGSPGHVSEVDIEVINAIGTLAVDTKKAVMLLVPTAESASSPPAPPNPLAHDVDHYKCYKVRKSKGTPQFPSVQVVVGDQFTSPPKMLDVKRPRLLCLPVDKNGEDIKNSARTLACYSAKPVDGEPAHVPQEGLFVANQFGPARRDTRREDMLCVPSAIALGSP